MARFSDALRGEVTPIIAREFGLTHEANCKWRSTLARHLAAHAQLVHQICDSQDNMADIQRLGRAMTEVPRLSQLDQNIGPGNSDPENTVRPHLSIEDLDRRRPWSSQGIKAVLSPSPTFTEVKIGRAHV